MDTARFIISIIVIVSLPVGLLLWLAIHPFAAFWRKLGPVWTYIILAVPSLMFMTWVIVERNALLAKDFGTNYITIGLALLCIVVGVNFGVQRKKQLTFKILSGIPELSEKQYPGELLTEGIYGKMRHPRYVEIFFWILGYALFANFLALYAVLVLSIPVIYLIVILEEKELRDRFGAEYEEYCRKVPRFYSKTVWSVQTRN